MCGSGLCESGFVWVQVVWVWVVWVWVVWVLGCVGPGLECGCVPHLSPCRICTLSGVPLGVTPGRLDAGPA